MRIKQLKQSWSILKTALGKIGDKFSYPQTFSIDNKSIAAKVQMAEGFNNGFSVISEYWRVTTCRNQVNATLHTCHNLKLTASFRSCSTILNFTKKKV